MKRGLRLKHIEVFRAVIASGSASKAGRALGLSQPAVSKIIAQAEVLAGVTLFERRQGRLAPTQLALKLYTETNVLFATLENVDGIVARAIRKEVQPIAIGAVPTLASTLLPRVLPQWREKIDRVVTLYTHEVQDLLSLLAAQRLELVITLLTKPTQGLASSLILRSPLYCLLPKGHALASKAIIEARDLDGLAYIALSRSEGAQTGLDDIFRAEGIKPAEVMQVPLMIAAVRMVEQGVGVTLVDVFGVHSARPDHVEFRRFAPNITFDICAVWPEDREPDFDRTKLVGNLESTARQMAKEAERLMLQ